MHLVNVKLMCAWKHLRRQHLLCRRGKVIYHQTMYGCLWGWVKWCNSISRKLNETNMLTWKWWDKEIIIIKKQGFCVQCKDPPSVKSIKFIRAIFLSTNITYEGSKPSYWLITTFEYCTLKPYLLFNSGLTDCQILTK